MTKQQKWIWGIIGLVIVGGIAWWGTKTQPNAPEGTVKIGIMTILSGDLAFLGENIVQSAELAWEDIKDDYSFDVEFVIEDVGGLADQSQAVSAFRKLTDVDGVQYIIDGMTSNSTMAIAPLIDPAEVVVVTPLTGGANIDNAAEYLFRNGPSDVLAGVQPARDLAEKFGYTKVAVLTDNAEYTNDIQTHFRNAYEGEIVVDEAIAPDATDYRTELLKIKASDAQALVIHTATGTSAHNIIKQATQLGIEVPIFTNFIAFGPNLFKVAGTTAEDVYIYDPEFNGESTAVQDFLSRYEARYSAPSTIPFHATGTYDAVKMAAEAIAEVGYDGSYIRNYFLKEIKNWSGFNGVISFDEKGNTQTGFILKQIKGQKLVVVQ